MNGNGLVAKMHKSNENAEERETGETYRIPMMPMHRQEKFQAFLTVEL